MSRRSSPRHAFSLLEIMLALGIVALVMAAIGPALVGVLRTQRQVRTVLEPLVNEQAALAVLRDDLLTAPRPNGSLVMPFTVVAGQVNGLRADTLQFLSNGAPPLHPKVALRTAEFGQAAVTWSAQASDDGHGFAWTRSRQVNLLATGIQPTPVAEVMLDHLAQLTVEVLIAGVFTGTYDSSNANDVLPPALRITYAYIQADGTPGPTHAVVIDLPQVALDPTQQDGGA